jgi:uncharacterized protein YbaP (TraB family)
VNRLIAGLLVITWHAGAFAQAAPDTSAAPRPLLWRVGSSAFVFGTIHLDDPRLTPLPVAVEAALDSCDAFIAEVPLDPATLAGALQFILLDDEQTLADDLPESTYVRTARYLAAHDFDIDALSRFDVWMLAATLPLLDVLGGVPLDQTLYTRCAAAGKRVGGLETIAEQLQILDSLDLPEEIHLLELTLDMLEEQGEDDAYVDRLLQLYLAGNAEDLLAFLFEIGPTDDPVVQKYMDRLLHQRNRLMAERIAAELRREPQTAFFFALGAGHLGGPDGVLARLRLLGFDVARVEPAAETVQR